MVLCSVHFIIKIILKICEGSELKQTGFPAALGQGDPPSPSGGGEEAPTVARQDPHLCTSLSLLVHTESRPPKANVL